MSDDRALIRCLMCGREAYSRDVVCNTIRCRRFIRRRERARERIRLGQAPHGKPAVWTRAMELERERRQQFRECPYHPCEWLPCYVCRGGIHRE